MDQQINDPPPPEEEEEEEVLLLVAAAISSSSADHDDLHKKYGIDVTYLTQEDVIKFKPSFWNVTQCQTDRLYSFYYQQEDMLVRRASHLRRVILGKENLVAPRLVLAERRQHQHQQYTSFGSSPATKEAYTTKPLVVDQYHPPCKNSSTSMTSAVQEHGEDNACTATATNTDIVISKNVLTDVIEASEILLDDIKSIMDFLSESKKNYMDVLTVFDAYHGTNVKDTELASLEESHTFFNGSRLKVLMDLIIEDVVDKAEKKLIMMNEDASMAITTTTSTSAADTTSGRNDASSYINDKDHAHFKKGVVSQKDDENSRSSSLSVCKHIGASKSRGAKGRGLNVFSWWSSLMTRREKTETEHQHQQDEKRSTIKERNKKSPTARSERQDSRSAAAGQRTTTTEKARSKHRRGQDNAQIQTVVSDKRSDAEQERCISYRKSSLRDSLTSIFTSRVLEKD